LQRGFGLHALPEIGIDVAEFIGRDKPRANVVGKVGGAETISREQSPNRGQHRRWSVKRRRGWR